MQAKGKPTFGATKGALKIITILQKKYPRAACGLRYRSRFQLLVAVILSAQTTDQAVNRVTIELFKRYGTVRKMASTTVGQVERIIRSLGLYRNKARNLINTARALDETYRSQVPKTREELMRLPGVGRKTANVVLTEGFAIPAITVDTHVSRLARRFAWTAETEPCKIEKDLAALFPEKVWPNLGHLLIAHGRNLCRARRPLCGECFLSGRCPWYAKKVRSLESDVRSRRKAGIHDEIK